MRVGLRGEDGVNPLERCRQVGDILRTFAQPLLAGCAGCFGFRVVAGSHGSTTRALALTSRRLDSSSDSDADPHTPTGGADCGAGGVGPGKNGYR